MTTAQERAGRRGAEKALKHYGTTLEMLGKKFPKIIYAGGELLILRSFLLELISGPTSSKDRKQH